jgi:hypothetical protein
MAKGIDAKLDKEWSRIVRERAGHCEYCGKTEHLNAHHIFGRRKKSVRFELANGVCLCVGCHKFSTDFSAHETPVLFVNWLRETRGDAFVDELTLMANTPKKWTKAEKEELLDELKRCREDEDTY